MNKRKPKVFVLDCIPSRFDLSTASTYGVLWAIETQPQPQPGEQITSQQLYSAIVSRIERAGYDNEIDYFLVAGHMVDVVSVACELVDRFAPVKLLVFNSALGRYVEHLVGANTSQGVTNEA